MRVVIVGQGAIGLLCYANALQNENDNQLTVELKPSSAKFQQYHALQFTTLEHNSTKLPLSYATDVSLKTADIVVICVKSYQLIEALESLIDKIGQETSIICCHNGIVSKQSLSEIAGKNRCIALMLTTHGSKKVASNQVLHTGEGKTDIGLLAGEASSEQVDSLTHVANQLLPNATWQENIELLQWQKLAVNAVINPITANYDIDNGAVLEEQFTELKQQLLEEFVQVAALQEISFDFETLLITVNEVASKTAANCSSMRADILNQRNTEIDTINGFIVQQGRQGNIDTPANLSLWRAIKQKEASGKHTAS